MGLFDIFRKKFVDDLFGELSYITFKDISKNFYDGTITFGSQQIGVILNADESGPTKQQKEFYTRLRDDFTAFKNEIIIPYLKKGLKDWEDKTENLDFDKELIIDGISIPRITNKPVQWSLTFYLNEIGHYVTIEFTDRNPKSIMVDG